MKRHKFKLPTGYRDSMSELDDALDKVSSDLEENKILTTYKNEIDWMETKYNLFILSILFIFSFLLSYGNWYFAILLTGIVAFSRNWRKIDKEIELNKEGVPVKVNNMDITSLLNHEITSLDQLNYEQMADFETAKAIATYLYESRTIDYMPSDTEIEQTFLRALNEKLKKEGQS